MIYLLLFLVAAAILLYVTSRWLRGELRELRAWLGEHWAVRRGGESQASLLQAAQRAFDAEGLELQFAIVSRQVLPNYRALRRRHVERTPERPLPAAITLALAADPDARRLYLRAIVPATDGPARDSAQFLDFDQIESVQAVAQDTPNGHAPAAEQALELRPAGPDQPPFRLAIESAWGLGPEELTRRVRELLTGDWRPEAPPTIVR